MRALAPALTLAALTLTAGCASLERALDEAESSAAASAGPRMTPMASSDLMPMPAMNTAAAGPSSLWRAGSRTFFADQRARRLGDILTVRVSIQDRAQMRNTTERERDGAVSGGVDSLFGKEDLLGRLLPPGGSTPFDPSNLVSAQGQSNASGSGSINRAESVDLTIAAIITEILPNGNFIVSGRQEVRLNNELRELLVSGVIRPEDISPDNSIQQDQMAEARISYGGRGVISNVQRPRLGQRALDAVSPF
jgi:flagellar L-ring protein precursor FlgH